MGGTQFVGRHVAEAALRRGHEITLFHRGISGPGLFAQADHLIGDRDKDLSSIATGQWDATVDLSGYVPRQVRQLHDALGERAGAYVLFSSTAAYDVPLEYGFREDSPLIAAEDFDPEEVNDDTYGGLKALCEGAAKATFGECLIVRPTYVVGPYDYTGRFTYWVKRIAEGGEVLAPGPAEEFFQLIDVRDLAEWIVGMVERQVVGTYQAATPFPPVTFGQLLTEITALVGPENTRLIWVDKQFLLDRGLNGLSLPMWPGANPEGIIEAADPARAIEVGLTPRSLADTILDLHNHEAVEPTPLRDPLWSYAGSSNDVGLTRMAEQRLLAEWRLTQ